MIHNISIRKMELQDLTMLHHICREAYSQNFYHHWEEGGLEYYVNDVFGEETLKKQLADPHILYYVAFMNDEPLAFMKLNVFSNLPEHDAQKGIELDKIYILPAFRGMKIGKQLLDLAFDIAKEQQKEIFWLSVIDTNLEAIAFYKKLGFEIHSRTRVEYPKFKEELKGMFRMYLKTPEKMTN